MTVLALKLSRRANAVSSLHGQVSRAMWTPLYPGRREERRADRPHHQRRPRPTWLAPQMRQVYDRHLGADWPQRSGEPGLWDAIDDVDDGELWETHQTLEGAADRRSRGGARRSRPSGAASRPRSSRSCGARSASTR